MKPRLIVTVITMALVLVVGLRIRAWLDHESARAAINQDAHLVQPVPAGRFVQVLDQTRKIDDFDREPFLDEAMRTEFAATGISPDLKGLIALYSHQVPAFDWFGLAGNRQALYVGRIKQAIMPPITSAIHVVESKDGAAYVCAYHAVEQDHIYLYTQEGDDIFLEARQAKQAGAELFTPVE